RSSRRSRRRARLRQRRCIGSLVHGGQFSGGASLCFPWGGQTRLYHARVAAPSKAASRASQARWCRTLVRRDIHRSQKRREIHRSQKARGDGAAVLSPQADAFTGVKAKEKVGLLRSE